MFDLNDLAMSTVYFIETSVLNFLDDENPTVRKEAMRTCCGVILPKSNNLRISWSMERIINKLLHKFFVTATTDNEDSIRVTMLKYLNSISSNRWLIMKIFGVLISFLVFFVVFIA